MPHHHVDFNALGQLIDDLLSTFLQALRDAMTLIFDLVTLNVGRRLGVTTWSNSI